MEFQAKVILDKKNPRARWSAAGAIVLIVSVFTAMVDGYERYAIGGFIFAVLLLIGGAVWAKGDLTDYGITGIYLIVSREGINIGSRHYPMEQLRNIDFDVNGYDGMETSESGLRAGGSSNGMDNELRFEAGGEKIVCRFYLESPQHVQQLGQLFQEFYADGVPFSERRGAFTTYLFQPMSENEKKETIKNYNPQ